MSYHKVRSVVFSGMWLLSASTAWAQVDIRLIPLSAAGGSDLVTTLPAAQDGFPVGSPFVVEVWAQTTDPNGFAQVSLDVSFNTALVSVVGIGHSAQFNLFASGLADNLLGAINNLSGSHTPVIPACSDSVGAAPGWARVATLDMTANAVGSFTMVPADAQDLIFVIANCGSSAPPVATFSGALISVTQCGNSIVEAGELCDDGNTVAGDCCSPTCRFESTATVCRAAADACDVADFCDGAGACAANAFQPAGATCGSAATSVCDTPDSCDGLGVCLPNFEPSTKECRPSAGDCDLAESCDGAGACSTDVFVTGGTACGNVTVSVCDTADTCDGSGTCQANPEPTTKECRAAASPCDAAETCDGSGACPIDSFQAEGVACGNQTTSVCDKADTCNGLGACQNNLEPATTVCRAAAGVCDVDDLCDGAGQCDVDAKSVAECRPASGDCDIADFCDGNANGCPADVFVVSGASCGDTANTTCDNPDTCNGAGLCEANFEPTTSTCRATTGDCDVAEFCDGLGRCPNDVVVAASTPCGDPGGTVCDNPDTCDGTGVCLANPEPGTTVCRAAADVCDVAESCDGAGICPANDFALAGVSCGDVSVSVCDGADTCDGGGTCLANPEPLTTACRSAAGACDIVDFCDGSGLCSADGKSTAECRAAAGDCDVSESCDGIADDCPVDSFVISGAACGNPATSVCDNPDTCDGGGFCQSNPEPVATQCRVSLGACDVADFCDGAGLCSIDGKSTAECRAAAGDCDIAESCDGIGNDCPLNVFVAGGAACGDGTTSVCDNPDTCDGGGVCLSNPEPVATECRAAVGVCDVADSCDGAGLCSADAKGTSECRAAVDVCDVAETCNGVGNDCPANGFATSGVSCGDASVTVCDNADTCDGGGACLSNPEPVATECRIAAGACDVADFCDGAGLCSADGKAVTECRAAADVCDVAETCNGIDNDCPANGFATVGVACGDPAVTVCDNADSCDGGGNCAANPEPATTECRPSAGACDVVDLCDGVGLCGADLKSTAECKPAVDVCDVAEVCNGIGNTCPVDVFAVAGIACGDPAVSVCDNPDTCDGGGGCATNPEPVTTECRLAAGACDAVDSCDGSGLCSADGKSTAECRVAVDACDVSEACNGIDNDCPIDGFAAAGAICGNATVTLCDDADSCDGSGTCNLNNVADGTPCSDVLFCNGDEACLAGACQLGPAVCTDACETCTEAAGVCAWCIFDHTLNSVMDGFDFSFFSGCFGVCVPPGDPCFAANYDGDPQGCVGGSDFGAFSGCFGQTCGECAGCSGPSAPGSVSAVASSMRSNASVQLVATEIPQFDDVAGMLPLSARSAAHGETFELEVWASLIGIDEAGLGSVYVDVAYDPSQLTVEAVIPSDLFLTFSHGTVESSAGLISALGGCAPLGEGGLGAASTWVRVATIRMRASGVGFSTVTAGPSYGPYGVSVFGRFGDLSPREIEFGEVSMSLRGRSVPVIKSKVRARN